jgi:hypothetical protein
MYNHYNIFSNDEYKFVAYSDVLIDIRNSFLDEMVAINATLPVYVNNAFAKRYIAHSTLEEVLKTYIHIDTSKINAILITNDTNMDSQGLLTDDVLFIDTSIRVLDQCKRTIPLLIKKINCDFDDIGEYLSTGDGIDFLNQLEIDRNKLRKSICSYSEFKKFAKHKGLTYITDKLIDKIEFKRLFVS